MIVLQNKDDIMNNQKKTEDAINWEDLLLARRETIEEIVKQQLLVSELTKLKQDIINNDNELYTSVIGLINVYKDLTEEVIELTKLHMDPSHESGYKYGNIIDVDDQLEYIKIASGYITIEEKVGYIASTSYLDIFLKLKMPTAGLEDTIKTHVENTAKEMSDGK